MCKRGTIRENRAEKIRSAVRRRIPSLSGCPLLGRLSGFLGVFLDAASPLLVGCAAAFILNIPMCFMSVIGSPGVKEKL